MRLFLFPAFGEILRQWYANVSAGPSLSGTHYGQNRPCGARVTMRSAAVEKPPCRRHFHLAGVIMLLDVGAAATEEQGQYGKRYAVSSRASPSAHCIHFCPQPRGGDKRPGTSLRINVSGSSPRLNFYVNTATGEKSGDMLALAVLESDED